MVWSRLMGVFGPWWWLLPGQVTKRRKTLAGISGFAGFPMQRSSPRLKNKNRKMPIAKLAEKVLCHRLGIVNEGEPVTEAAISKFIQMFKIGRAHV